MTLPGRSCQKFLNTQSRDLNWRSFKTNLTQISDRAILQATAKSRDIARQS